MEEVRKGDINTQDSQRERGRKKKAMVTFRVQMLSNSFLTYLTLL